MDNYQKELMRSVVIRDVDEAEKAAQQPQQPRLNTSYNRNAPMQRNVSNVPKRLTVSVDRDEITIRQDEDITVTKYRMGISGRTISALFSMKGTRETPVRNSEENGKTEYVVTLDFEDKIDAIKISFGGLANDLTIPVKFIDADKEKYYEKKRQAEGEEKYTRASIGYSIANGTAGCIVNISFRPCEKDYAYTDISLYKTDFKLLTGPGKSEVTKEAYEIMRFKKTGDDYFLAVSGLAPADYLFALRQYGKNGELLIDTGLVRMTPVGGAGNNSPSNQGMRVTPNMHNFNNYIT